MRRTRCVFCDSDKLETLYSVSSFPIYMGSTQSLDSEKEDLTYGKCLECNGVQILNLVELDTLYAENHNTEVVGGIWQRHFASFQEFIKRSENIAIVLEIGDPSFKLESVLAKCKKWYLVQPNLKNFKLPKKVTYIDSFVNNDLPLKLDDKVDAVVMSHVFEHLYDPREVLGYLKDCLSEDGSIFISIPNFKESLKGKKIPPLNMHFEHTFFASTNKVIDLFNGTGFDVEQVYNFETHSVFLQFKKKGVKADESVKEILSDYAQMVEEWNNSYSKYYLYGCHFPAQLLVSLGLDTKKIICVLDNSQMKQGKLLYGTNLRVESPTIIEKDSNPIVCCEMGVYNDEIKKQLKGYNSDVLFYS